MTPRIGPKYVRTFSHRTAPVDGMGRARAIVSELSRARPATAAPATACGPVPAKAVAPSSENLL